MKMFINLRIGILNLTNALLKIFKNIYLSSMKTMKIILFQKKKILNHLFLKDEN